ncbi:hypothetical protein A1O3_04719 [Capronia epimyces CBS 606.96]|uniref:C2H2-type domain-containing protein n=1 Tax=Capronia epimyces CBS 606.96 TaxID=1182542 RepID=W9XU24_9EURO|nr:uncharacterized protein A1O3_04719 [Capronia epimyces CBS 606.96]EXJ84052.1 hypothetical protein A1O3_04719 [Capronia epimyces CBS 606.96]
MLPGPTQSKEVIEIPPVLAKYLAQEDLKEFECPYCFTMCSKRLLHKKAWTAHILKDLRPYVCTYERCPDASQLYDSFTDWANHENQAHGYVHQKRTDQGHEHGISEPFHANTAAASAAMDNVSLAPGRTCPFCQDTFDAFGKAQQHVANHLIRIALFAMPRSVGAETEDEAQDGKSDQNATGVTDEDQMDVSLAHSVALTFDSTPQSPREALVEDEDRDSLIDPPSPIREDDDDFMPPSPVMPFVERTFDSTPPSPQEALADDLSWLEDPPSPIREDDDFDMAFPAQSPTAQARLLRQRISPEGPIPDKWTNILPAPTESESSLSSPRQVSPRRDFLLDSDLEEREDLAEKIVTPPLPPSRSEGEEEEIITAKRAEGTEGEDLSNPLPQPILNDKNNAALETFIVLRKRNELPERNDDASAEKRLKRKRNELPEKRLKRQKPNSSRSLSSRSLYATQETFSDLNIIGVAPAPTPRPIHSITPFMREGGIEDKDEYCVLYPPTSSREEEHDDDDDEGEDFRWFEEKESGDEAPTRRRYHRYRRATRSPGRSSSGESVLMVVRGNKGEGGDQGGDQSGDEEVTYILHPPSPSRPRSPYLAPRINAPLSTQESVVGWENRERTDAPTQLPGNYDKEDPINLPEVKVISRYKDSTPLSPPSLPPPPPPARPQRLRRYVNEDEPDVIDRDRTSVDNVPRASGGQRMDGVGSASGEITWQRDNGPSYESPKGLWTEITKDMVEKEAIVQMGFECEETEDFYYVTDYLRYEDVAQLVRLSDDIRRERRARVRSIVGEDPEPAGAIEAKGEGVTRIEPKKGTREESTSSKGVEIGLKDSDEDEDEDEEMEKRRREEMVISWQRDYILR